MSGSSLHLQILNYHETTASPSGCLHVLTDAEFDRQMDMVVAHRVQVIPASHLTECMRTHRGQGVAITFDDGCKSDLRNAQQLRRRGLTATFFISSANVGQPGYLDADEIRELVCLGMVIGSHAHQHVRLTTLPDDVMAAEVRQSKEILESIVGQPVDQFAFPGGAFAQREIAALQAAGFTHAHGTDWGVNAAMPCLRQGVVRRTNVIQGTSEADFLKLVRFRGAQWRRMVFQAKTLLQRSLPDGAYRIIRDNLVRL